MLGSSITLINELIKSAAMDKLKLTGRNLARVFHSRLRRTCIVPANVHITKQPNFKLKTRPKQLLGSLQLAFALPAAAKFDHLAFGNIVPNNLN